MTSSTMNDETHEEQQMILRESPTKVESIEGLQRLATAFVRSGFFALAAHEPVAIAQAAVKIQAGMELGIPPFASMRGVNVIQGSVALSANLMAALVKKSGRYKYRVTVSSDERCLLTWFEREGSEWEQVGTSDFTIEEARNAGLVRGGSGWTKFPADMLFARALSRGFRRYCPDLGSGVAVYVEGEIEDAPARIPANVDLTTGEVVEETAVVSELRETETTSNALVCNDESCLSDATIATPGGYFWCKEHVPSQDDASATLEIDGLPASDEQLAALAKIAVRQDMTFEELLLKHGVTSGTTSVTSALAAAILRSEARSKRRAR